MFINYYLVEEQFSKTKKKLIISILSIKMKLKSQVCTKFANHIEIFALQKNRGKFFKPVLLNLKGLFFSVKSFKKGENNLPTCLN